MSTPPAPQATIPPSSDMRVLLIIVGVIICLAGLCTLCVGGLYSVMLQGFSVGLAEIKVEIENGNIDPAEAEIDIENIDAEWLDRVGALIPLFTATIFLGTLLALGAHVWLGVGSILCRRWAWKLLYAAGWLWIGWIALSMVNILASLPAQLKMMEAMNEWLATSVPPPPTTTPGTPGTPTTPPTPAPTMPVGIMSGYSIISAIIQLMVMAVPGVLLVVIFGLRNVRLTCEAYDPKPRWTDRTPVPILIFWLVLVLGALGTLVGIIPGTAIVATIWGGKAAFLSATVSVLYVVAFVVALRAVGRMNLLGWWIMLVLSVLQLLGFMIAASLLTPEKVLDWIETSGWVPEDVWKSVQESMPPNFVDLIVEASMNWAPMLCYTVAMLGFLFWVRRYFPSASTNSPPQDPVG